MVKIIAAAALCFAPAPRPCEQLASGGAPGAGAANFGRVSGGAAGAGAAGFGQAFGGGLDF